MNNQEVTAAEVDSLYKRLRTEAEAAGYHINPDLEFTKELIKSLLLNERRYDYRACPCRLASGNKEDDLDIICPCDYRDHDLIDYDACYCALYVSEAVRREGKQVGSIPERRPLPTERKRESRKKSGNMIGPSLPVWRCRVCGYLCAREQPSEVCPICKARKDRFERFLEPTV
ncbi:ferredoxin-thioredoxin reductase catalytic domain-containing protein [Chloroflexota bacterium]